MDFDNKIPVVLVTGFLGAGKTTFINDIIRNHQHLKLALVENEFGEKSIDKDLIIGMRAENIFDLSNGCICCSISNEFTLTLLDLAEKAGEIEYLIIETTGVADLSNVIKPFYSDDELKEKYTLAGSICLVDALNHDIQFSAGEQQMQLILSDLLLVNKSSEIPAGKVNEIEKKLKAFNTTATIELCNFGNIDGFKLEKFAENVIGNTEKRLNDPFKFRLVESKNFNTYTHEFPGTIDLERFKYWFNYFVSINQLQVYRIKGFVFPNDSANKVIVQAVGGAVEYTEGSYTDPTSEKLNRLVFIGKDLDFNRVAFELDNYLFPEE